MRELYEVTACEHGKWESHPLPGTVIGRYVQSMSLSNADLCPGGSRRRVVVDYERADAAFRIALAVKEVDVEGLPTRAVSSAIVDAALGFGEDT